jgi:prepilin-type N-terminal cleavage/methylation domain-containing protein
MKIINLLKKLFKNEKGFSLSELIVVMSIVSTVSAVGTTQIDDIIPTARDAQRKANIHQVQTALNLYYDDNLKYPISSTTMPSVASWNEMKNILENPSNIYMPEVPADPLNTENYVFKYWSDGNTFKLVYETEDTNDNSPLIAWGM